MPIYDYRCSSCGVQKDVMQKISDPVLTTCPECGQETFAKQLTAAGFQLKGNGYYVTDFKNKQPAACEPAACSSCPAAGTH
jgi:putative FmdB family regulatory protein